MGAVSVAIPASPKGVYVLLLIAHEERPAADCITALGNEEVRELIADLSRALTVSDARMRQYGAELVLAPGGERASEAADVDAHALAALEPRLERAEDAIRRQQRKLNALTASYVERFSQPNGHYPSYCCQRCGEQIGWIGRGLQAIGIGLHACPSDRETA